MARGAGWSLIGQFAQRDEATPDVFLEDLLLEIERTIHTAPNAQRIGMNAAVITIGCRSPRFGERPRLPPTGSARWMWTTATRTARHRTRRSTSKRSGPTPHPRGSCPPPPRSEIVRCRDGDVDGVRGPYAIQECSRRRPRGEQPPRPHRLCVTPTRLQAPGGSGQIEHFGLMGRQIVCPKATR